jgi:hypothetical protein
MSLAVKGFVEIYQQKNDELIKIYEGDNIITRGLGYSVTNLLTEQEDINLSNFQIAYFQLGTGKIDFDLENPTVQMYFYELNIPLTYAQYGDNIDSEITKNYSLTDTAYSSGLNLTKGSLQSYVELPNSRCTRYFDRSARFRLFIEKNMANTQEILEMGLFVKNPDSTYKQNNPILAAYKTITSSISKNSECSLIIDWTISVVDQSEI